MICLDYYFFFYQILINCFYVLIAIIHDFNWHLLTNLMNECSTVFVNKVVGSKSIVVS